MKRELFEKRITKAFRTHPIVAILGPRQCGKTTISRIYTSEKENVTRFDLENPRDLAALQNPLLTLETLEGLIILDEIQRVPELFQTLRVLVDEPGLKQKFLILGSASKDLIKQSSETLAGRIAYLELTPFNYTEAKDLQKLWIRGGFPKSYLAENIEDSIEWRKFYVTTFLEKDIPNLGIQIPPHTLRRFWMMLAHYHGNTFNASEIGRSLGISNTTIRHYLDILIGVFMVRQLQPWVANIKKRQVKSPKIYFRDSGIFHSLMGITNFDALRTNPKIGASWEGVAFEEIIRYHQADFEDCYFWSTYSGAELDLLIVKDGKKLGFEFKYKDAPRLTKSMQISEEDLNLDDFTVIFPGKGNFPLTEKIKAIGLETYLSKE